MQGLGLSVHKSRSWWCRIGVNVGALWCLRSYVQSCRVVGHPGLVCLRGKLTRIGRKIEESPVNLKGMR